MAEKPRDPFKPSSETLPTVDLLVLPASKAAPQTIAPMAPSQPRQPLNYRSPRTGWVMVVVLLLAVIGFATVGRPIWLHFTGKNLELPSLGDDKKPEYKSLEMDDAVLVDIDVTPAHAKLNLDGEPLPSNPVRLPRDGQTHRITATAPDHEPATYTFLPDKAKTLQLKLLPTHPTK